MDVLERINDRVFSEILYVKDKGRAGVSDFWGDPRDVIRRGYGDCEDMAGVAAYWLNLAGVPTYKTIAVQVDTRGGSVANHMFCAAPSTKGYQTCGDPGNPFQEVAPVYQAYAPECFIKWAWMNSPRNWRVWGRA